MTASAVSDAQMLEALKQDLSAESGLPGPVQSVLLDIRGFVNVPLFDVVPDPDMIAAVIEDIEEELVSTGRAVRLPGYGLLRMVRTNPVERFEMISEFLIDRVIPKYRSRGNCRKELAQIAVEEAIYQIDRFAAPAVEFRVRRAMEVKKAVWSPEMAERFPGALAVEAIIAMAPVVKDKYQEAWQTQNEQVIDGIKKGLQGPPRHGKTSSRSSTRNSWRR